MSPLGTITDNAYHQLQTNFLSLKDSKPGNDSAILDSTAGRLGLRDSEKISRGRGNADCLVGDSMQPNYNASGTLEADIAMFGTRLLPLGQDQGARTTRTETFDGTLTVKGIVLGSVTTVATHHIWDYSSRGPSNGRLGYSLKEDDLPSDKVPERLWRTLVAGGDLGGHQPPAWYKRACLYSLQRVDNSGSIHTWDLIEALDPLEQMVTYLKRVQNVVWNREIFKGGADGEILG